MTSFVQSQTYKSEHGFKKHIRKGKRIESTGLCCNGDRRCVRSRRSLCANVDFSWREGDDSRLQDDRAEKLVSELGSNVIFAEDGRDE